MPSDDLDDLQRLRVENEELRRRIDVATEVIDELRAEALERRREVRELAEALPTAMSRHALLRQMAGDALHHPDRLGAIRRSVRKLGRAPGKLARIVRNRAAASR